MGRRPNSIVADFFDRGAKLDDSSNRYEHTCRRCGELFPKGRVDHLVSHLLKRCPYLTPAERDHILLRAQQNAVSRKTANLIKDQAVQSSTKQDLRVPPSLERQQSALDTLAEVSRRHLDYSSQRDPTYDQNAILQDAEQALAEQALWTQLQQHNMSVSDAQAPAESVAVPETTLPSLSEAQLSSNDIDMSATQPETYLRVFDSDATLPPFSTADFTSSLQAPHDSHKHDTLDPQLGSVQPQQFDTEMYLAEKAAEPAAQDQSKATQLRWASQLTSSVSQDAFKTAVQTGTTRAKHRGRFTEDRRKEVQETRKRGACLRCRMLKKPCSEGTPCKTCANVDTARLWKDKCIRTRLDNECQAWQSDYFLTIQRRATIDLIPNPERSQRLYIKLDFDISQGFGVSARVERKLPYGYNISQGIPNDAPSILAIDPAEDLQEKITAYCMTTQIMGEAIKNEYHKFIQVTLLEAVDLLSKEALAQQDDSMKETRTCYNVANSLTRDSLELWILTICLTKRTGMFSPRFAVATPGHQMNPVIEAQLLAAVEQKCARLSKRVLNDLERRLLQRRQVSGFATFIAAVILVHSLERMTAFFQSFDAAENDQTKLIWPLDGAGKTPREYWQQGLSFTALLGMLLRIRGLPPKTREDANGKLAVVNDVPAKFVKLNGSATEEQLRVMEEERTSALTAWLARCELPYAESRAWTLQCGKDWYGRLMAGLLVQ